jgi:hypothetical protein
VLALGEDSNSVVFITSYGKTGDGVLAGSRVGCRKLRAVAI